MDVTKLHRVSDHEWSIHKKKGMNVDASLFAGENLIKKIDNRVYEQIVNAASLPGILDRLVVFPNTSPGIGFPYGAMALFDKSDGIICPGAAGYDINCGTRIVTTNLIYQDIEKKTETLIRAFFKAIPVGDSTRGKTTLSIKDFRDLLMHGAKWVVEHMGMGKPDDPEYIEDGGVSLHADPNLISDELLKNEKNHLGTLGAENHYLELQIVDEVFDIERARVYGLFKNQVVVTFQTGSRNLGMEVAKKYIQSFQQAQAKYNITTASPELASLPSNSPESREYLAAMHAVSNFAFANRQVIGIQIDRVFNDVIRDVDTNIMYDFSHNTIKEEVHKIGTSKRSVLVHRCGCARVFPSRPSDAVKPYRVIGHPILVAGPLGAASYIMAGTEDSLVKTFGSSIHNTGRIVSREDARQRYDADAITEHLKSDGVYLKSKSRESVIEEAPEAFNDIEDTVKSLNKPGISIRVARLKPIGVIRG
jgi:tRNA-splicing ligase RtcB